ncbi:MAG: indolepyruvate ferredoxin oxidoreductase family protein, partial [Rhodobacteraceae bacterium]|nr:indolepyruvate ferredoxin oxidoreductase family protein [Paracoccaceae bacterium]
MTLAQPIPAQETGLRPYRLSDRYTASEVFLTGTQALVRLVLEQARADRAAGRRTAGFVSGYRGSPLAGLDMALGAVEPLLQEHDIRFQPAINEDLAATALIGTQEVESDPRARVEGVFGIWYGKGPGVDRAGDALKHGNALGASPRGGVLALVGDDHGCVSSSMPHQSDQALIHYMMPVIHPGCVADYVPFGLWGIAASRFSGAWVGMKTISEVVESGATLRVAPPRPFALPAFEAPAFGLHTNPANAFGPVLEQRMLARLQAVQAFAAANPLDRASFGATRPRLAIVASGKAHADVLAALARLGITRAAARGMGLGVASVGLVWPLSPAVLGPFLEAAEVVVVVEEKRAVIEPQLREMLWARPGARPALLGKRDAFAAPLLPEEGEIDPAALAPLLARALGLPLPEGAVPAPLAPPDLGVSRRIPYFCSGCPHNRSTRLPEGSEALPGIGCHFMATWMGRETRGLVQMGGEGVNWLGRAPFVEQEHIFQNIGDGTYFHSGLLAIRQALAARARITYKILYNDAVAMTGGQAVDGAISVPGMVEQLSGEGVARIAIVSEDPARLRRLLPRRRGVSLDPRARLEAVQPELRGLDGVSVLIYEQGCAAEKRRKRKRGQMAEPRRRVFINPAVCEGCGDCSVQSNCVSIRPLPTEWGVKRQIDQSSCNKDFSCLDGFCPSFVTLEGADAPETGDATLRARALAEAATLPAPSLPEAADLLVAGVGGTGVVTIGMVLATAAHLERKGASVLDFTGFAQKGGAVITHLRLRPAPFADLPARIEAGRADGMIACDLVVATQGPTLEALAPGRAQVVAETDIAPTAEFTLRGLAGLEADRRLDILRRHAGGLHTARAEHLAQRLFGDTIYSNMMLTGMAWQMGRVPVGRESIHAAIGLNGRAVEANRDAFEMGRLLAARPAALEDDAQASALDDGLDAFLDRRAAHLHDWGGPAIAEAFRAEIEELRAREAALGSERLTRIVAAQLSRLIAVKDEYEVARLHLAGTALGDMRARLAPGARLRFHLAPPLLSFLRDGRGRPRKIAVPGWLALPAFRALRAARRLRGSLLDPL